MEDLLAAIEGGEYVPEWKRLVLTHPDVFIRRYFKHRIDQLEEFHLRLIDTSIRRARGMILYPAAHGKTTLVSTCLPIWETCRDANMRMGIIAKNEDEGEGIMRVILAEMSENDDLIRDFGPFKPGQGTNKPWGLGAISVANRTRIAKEPTLTMFGAGSKQVLGHRTDWTICDDVVSEKNSSTPEQRQKMREWFNQSVETMCEFPDRSRLTVVGTLFDPADLYNDLIDLRNPITDEPIYHVQREDALIEDPDTGEILGTLWEAKWSYESLMIQKEKMGTLDFNKRYRNIAVDKSRMVFKEEYVRGGKVGGDAYPGCLDYGYTVGDFDQNWFRYAGFDPAIGKGRSAKFCVHLTLGVGSCAEHERCIWVIDLMRDQMASPRQRDEILRRHEEYGLIATIVESNSLQEGLRELIVDEMNKRGHAFAIEPHYTTRTNKPDPEAGVQAMAPWFEQGKVHIPYGDPHSRRLMKPFIEELIEYPGRTDDTVMAFWFAWRKAMQGSNTYRSFSELERRGSMWAPVGRRVVKNPAYAMYRPGGE